jgi:hypothetical protein
MDIYAHPKGEVYNYSLPPPLSHFVLGYRRLELKLAIVYIFLVGGTLGKGHKYTVMGINVHIYKIMKMFIMVFLLQITW